MSLTLLGRFTLASALLAFIMALVLGAFTAAQAMRAGLNDAAATIVQATDSLLSPYLVKGDFSHPLWPTREATLDRLITQHVLERGITRVRLWNPGGTVVYSNHDEDLGSTVARTPELAEALGGRPVAVIRRPAYTVNAAAINASGQVLAVYAPVRLRGDATPLGAYEVHLDATPLLAQIHTARVRAWQLVLVGTGVLYASLIGLVYRAHRTMRKQQDVYRDALEGTIRSIAAAIDAKDSYIHEHSSIVSRHAVAIAKALRLSAGDVEALRVAGYLHDVGKIGIQDSILTKPASLNEEEGAKIRNHSVIGYRILQPIPIDDRIKLAILHAHERWDGRGYPDGLRETQIPIHARILLVADAFDALTSNRPYRPAVSRQEAIAQLREEAGQKFDPEIVEAFIGVLEPAPKPERGRVRSRRPAAGTVRP